MFRICNRLDNKKKTDSVVEMMPDDLIKVIPSGVTDIIGGYVDSGEFKEPTTLYTLFSSSRKQILSIVEYAGPLDQLERCIRQAYARNEPDLEEILMRAIGMAVKGLDFTIRNEKGMETDKGMTEILMELYAELFPHHKDKALEKARETSGLPKDQYLTFLEKIILNQQKQQTVTVNDEKKETNRKSDAALKQLFNAFAEGNDEILQDAIKSFKEFVNDQQKGLINHPDLYYANLMHLVNNLRAFSVRWNGKNIDHFYGDILGALRESVNRAAMMQMFDAFESGNQERIDNAIEAFKQFNKQNEILSITEQGCFINNLFNINQIHLMYCAFDELDRRGDDFPVDQRLFGVIGTLQLSLPPRIRQILHERAYNVLSHRSYPARRTINVDDVSYHHFKDQGDKYILGVNACYGISGHLPMPIGYEYDSDNSSIFLKLLQTCTPGFNNLPVPVVSLPVKKAQYCLLM